MRKLNTIQINTVDTDDILKPLEDAYRERHGGPAPMEYPERD